MARPKPESVGPPATDPADGSADWNWNEPETRKLGTGNWRLATGDWKLETGNWKPETGYWPGNWKLETGYWGLATGDWQPIHVSDRS